MSTSRTITNKKTVERAVSPQRDTSPKGIDTLALLQEDTQFKEKLIQAAAHPYLWPEIDDRLKKEQIISHKYVYGELSSKAFDCKLKELESKTPPLIVNSLHELEAIMTALMVDEVIKKNVLIEMDLEYKQAVSQGYLCRFSIWIYQVPNQGIAMYCATQVRI